MKFINLIKKDFPIFNRQINGQPLVYLDSAATSQKPQEVIDAVVDYYWNHNANVHRGIHTLGDESTRLYEESRKTVSGFIGAKDPNELIFVRNSTEAINLVAYSWGRQNVNAGDEILISEMEHHSNLVPWQMLAERQKATLQYIKVDKNGKLDILDLKRKLSPRTKLVSVVHVSNFLGTINPIKKIAEMIKKQKILQSRIPLRGTKNKRFLQPLSLSSYPLLLVDGAQAVPHTPVNVKDLGCDFYAFSGHKMYGPMGIGCLWGKREILKNMPPFLTGGGMINTVDWQETTFTGLPDKFEAGTPNVAGAVGLAAAVKYLQGIGMENIRKHEIELTRHLIASLDSPARNASRSEAGGSARRRLLARNDGLLINILGPKNAQDRSGLVAFTLSANSKEIHGHDVAQVLDSQGIAVRSGHHCVMPLHAKLGLAATTRVSFGIYNTKEDINRFIKALNLIPKIFG
ncbi:cysteine desulfurase [Candidatus Collierbacteria bacterium]|nr:cysteine desulfurase [Candidatus Collierbacteria bacterium]